MGSDARPRSRRLRVCGMLYRLARHPERRAVRPGCWRSRRRRCGSRRGRLGSAAVRPRAERGTLARAQRHGVLARQPRAGSTARRGAHGFDSALRRSVRGAGSERHHARRLRDDRRARSTRTDRAPAQTRRRGQTACGMQQCADGRWVAARRGRRGAAAGAARRPRRRRVACGQRCRAHAAAGAGPGAWRARSEPLSPRRRLGRRRRGVRRGRGGFVRRRLLRPGPDRARARHQRQPRELLRRLRRRARRRRVRAGSRRELLRSRRQAGARRHGAHVQRLRRRRRDAHCRTPLAPRGRLRHARRAPRGVTAKVGSTS